MGQWCQELPGSSIPLLRHYWSGGFIHGNHDQVSFLCARTTSAYGEMGGLIDTYIAWLLCRFDGDGNGWLVVQ